MKLKDRVANRIKAIRKSRDLTQEQLAEKIERTVFAASQLERGLSLPSFETLERLSQALHVPVRDFFDADEEDKRSPHRTLLMTALTETLRQLSDDDLEKVTRIVQIMWPKHPKAE